MSANTYHRAPDAINEAPPGCPMHQHWSPLDEDYLADPYPIAAALRDEHPVFYANDLGHVVVTKMAVCRGMDSSSDSNLSAARPVIVWISSMM